VGDFPGPPAPGKGGLAGSAASEGCVPNGGLNGPDGNFGTEGSPGYPGNNAPNGTQGPEGDIIWNRRETNGGDLHLVTIIRARAVQIITGYSWYCAALVSSPV